jgi:hypothetical protein
MPELILAILTVGGCGGVCSFGFLSEQFYEFDGRGAIWTSLQ